MAERRLQLEPASSLQKERKDKDTKSTSPTLRFDLKLDHTKSGSSNEFSYQDLCFNAEVKAKNKSDNILNFEGDDDDDAKLQEIARKFEEKYNPKSGRRKRRKGAISEDYVDRGMGYDETDYFIDNDEAYDELVPSTLTTEFGGFYINAGTLEFKNMSESESIGDVKARKKKRKKEDKEIKKRKIFIEDDHNPKRRGRKPANATMSALTKLKKRSQPTVADMLQQQKAKLHQQHQEKLQQIHLIPITVERNVIDISSEIKSELAQCGAIIGPAPKSTILDSIESVVKASAEEAISNGSAVSGSSDEEVVKSGSDSVAPKLPDNLPPDLDDLVKKLKEAAHNSEEGKCKFFSIDVNNILLSVELKSQELSSTQRSTIYSHLASHLPCTKETLQKRAKKLRLDQEDHKLREPMQKLKDAIVAVLPEMIGKYETMLKTPIERKEDTDADIPVLTDEETDDDENCDLPKKVFEWNDTTRQYLCDVVRIKLKCYEVSKTRVQSAEDYLKSFFRSEIKPLWPKGWMFARTLLKESREAHCHITNRPKRAIVLPKKSVSPAIMTIKPTLLTLNNAMLPHECNTDPVISAQRCVPSNMLPEMERKIEVKPFDDIKQVDLIKLLTYPIKNSVSDNIVCPQISSNTEAKIVENLSSKCSISSQIKGVLEQNIRTTLPQNKLPITSGKTELTNYADGSLASDMLACIIRASLADFPYAGSSSSDNLTSKTKGVISSSASLPQSKDTHPGVSSLPSEVLVSQIKSEDIKPVKIETHKPSQEIVANVILTNSAMELSSNSHLSNKLIDVTSSLLVKSKLPQSDLKSPVNLKLSNVMESRQFADAFEQSDHLSPSRRLISCSDLSKAAFPNLHRHIASSATTSLVFSNSGESSVSTTSKVIHENPPRVTQDLSTKLNTCSFSQVSTAPYKKRTKYSQGNKTADKWNPYLDSGLNTSLLEGMKGFPFPVTTLPTPPPAHCSVPIKTSQIKDPSYVLHSQPSPQTSSILSNSNLIRLDLKSNFSKTSESSQQNQQPLAHIRLPLVESSRRQSLIKNWKPSQSSATSHNQFLGNSSTLLAPKSTSPSICSSVTHQNPTIVYAHSHSSSLSPEKASLSHVPVHGGHSSIQGHTPQSSTVHLPHINQNSFLLHQQTSHSTTNQPPAHSRSSTPFVHSLPSTTSSSLAATFTFSQDQKGIPRPN